MSTLHFSAGRVLLQDTAGGDWYYLDVEVLDGVPRIRPGQTVIVPEADEPGFSPAAILLGPDDAYYSFAAEKVGANVYDSLVPASAAPPVRLFVKGSDGLYYEIFVTLGEDNLPYLEVGLASTNVSSIGSPWRTITAVAEDTSKRKSITPASARDLSTIIVPTTA